MKQIYHNNFAMFKLGKALCGRYNAEKPMYRLYYFYINHSHREWLTNERD